MIFLLALAISTNTVSSSSEMNIYLRINKNNKGIRIAYKYDSSTDMWIDFKKCGVNSILAISHLYLVPNKNKKVNPDLSRDTQLFLESCTDWIGPYFVRANQNGDDKETTFTGGWHGSNGDGTGNPTARTVNYKVYADKKKAVLDKVISCKEVKIEVINLVQGYNTKSKNREILRETVCYTVCHNKIDVAVEIEALEDVTISRYYGLQTQNSAWQGTIFYVNGIGEKDGIDSKINSTSGNKKEYPDVNSYYLCSKEGNHKLIAWLDRNYGLGDMEYVADNLPCAFTQSYGKSYYNLVNGKEKVLLKGEKLFWCGGYIIGGRS